MFILLVLEGHFYLELLELVLLELAVLLGLLLLLLRLYFCFLPLPSASVPSFLPALFGFLSLQPNFFKKIKYSDSLFGCEPYLSDILISNSDNL